MIFTVVCDVLGEENNGTVIATVNLIKYLAEKGHEVRVISVHEKDIENVKWYHVKELSFGFIIDKIIRKNQVELARGDKRVLATAIKGSDCVHIEWPAFLGRQAIKICRDLSIPVTASFHCQAQNISAHFGLGNNRFINRLIYRNFYNHAYKYIDAIHYPTDFIREQFERAVHHKTNGYIISNGVRNDVKRMNVEKPEYLKDKFVILSTGRLCGEKSQSFLIKAIAESKYKDKIYLILAGGGPDKEKLEKLIKKYQINYENNFYEHEDLIKTINMCDLYVHPARYELEGIACLEAIACGKTTIVSDSKLSATKGFAVSDFLVFDHRRVGDLRAKIDYFIKNPDKLAEYGEKCYNSNKIYDLPKAMSLMEEMLIKTSKIEKTKPQKVRYYKDELNDDFAGNNISNKPISPDYKYKRGLFAKTLGCFIKNVIVKFLVFLYVKIIYLQKTKNKKVLKDARKKGAIMYYNHTGMSFDAFIPNTVPYFKDAYIITGPEAFNIKPIASIVKILGGIPIGSGIKSYKNMLKEIKRLISRRHIIAIYPEAHIWPFYNDIRPLSNASFHYPLCLNVPAYAVTNCFSKRKFGKLPKITTYVDGPFYPKSELSGKENVQHLRDACYNAMKKRAVENSNYAYYLYRKSE